MSFVYPQFLFGLFALSIPILIHLFNFRKTKRVYFSNNQFLKSVKEATSSQLKLKHYLILASRLLFILFLVLTFAQPYIPGEDENADPQSGGAGKTVYIYLDNSQSMSSEISSNVSGLDLGVNYIREIIDLYPRNTRYKLLTNDFTNFSRVPKNPGEMEEQITEIQLSNITRSIPEVNSKIKNDMQTSNFGNFEETPPEVFLISDFQKSTAGNLQEIKFDTTQTINIVPVESNFTTNVFVDSVYLANPLLLAEQNNEITVQLRNVGDQPVNDQIIKLIINGQQVANASTNIPSNGSSELTFNLNFPLQDLNRCHLEFEDFPVAFDNDFYFTLNVSEKISVLEVKSGMLIDNLEKNGNPQAASPVEKVFGNEELFNFASYSIDNINYSIINNSDLLVLNELGSTFSNQGEIAILPYLKNFVQNGGHLIYIPPANGNLTLLGEMLGRSNLIAGGGGQGYTMVPANEDTVSADSVARNRVDFSSPDFNMPFFEDMFESEQEFNMPEARKIINPGLRGQTLLSYQTGEPFLFQLSNSELGNLNNGNIFLFGTPLRGAYTDFYRHALFVPVMYRLASLSKSINKQLYHYIDQTVISLEAFGERYLDNEPGDRVNVGNRSLFKMVKDEQELIPGQRMVGNRLIMELPNNVLNPGFYNLFPREQTNTSLDENQPLQTLSFNINKQESYIEQFKENELNNIFGDYKNVNIFEPTTDAREFNRQIKEEEVGTALWKYALILALVFLFTEIMLIRFL